ncbi:MAG TPA: hypothetical protein VMU20_07180 [Candidatus Dormibacteraeota bacterium]|nr:hypothetical protein [Candidatus Dormibacteraeota bacterium]
MRRLLVAAVLAGAATGCGASGGGAAPASARSPAAAGATAAATPAEPSPAAMERGRFFALLAANGDAAVFHRDGWTDARLETLFHGACDEIHHGATVDDTFVKERETVSAQGGADADALASAFADAWGAGLTAFCPDATGR